VGMPPVAQDSLLDHRRLQPNILGRIFLVRRTPPTGVYRADAVD
jgi:hypothetical protein